MEQVDRQHRCGVTSLAPDVIDADNYRRREHYEHAGFVAVAGVSAECEEQ